MKKLMIAAFALAAIAFAPKTFAQTKMEGRATRYPPKDIMDNAVNSKDHTTRVAAVKAAGLVETLKGDGPFTVFAPTNEAFAKLPAGTVESLLKPENKEKLVAVLTYHVIPGKVMKADVAKLDGQSVKTVQGSPVKVAVGDGGVMVNDAKVVATDI